MTKPESQTSSGSYIASQLPLGDGQGLPVSWQLCVIMAHVFLLFNQGLFVLMSFLKDVQADAGLSDTFGILSLGVAVVVAIVWVVVFKMTPVKKAIDWVVVVIAALLTNLPFIQQIEILSISSLVFILLANGLASIWLGRGLIGLWLAKKP